MRAVRVRASAKINLDLRILGRRADGYHELRTIFQSLALHDVLVCRTSRGPFVLESSGTDVPLDAKNLVWRAAQALWTAAGRAGRVRGVTVSLRKRIPVRAGLGGGSSDAAATLAGLDALWRTRLPPADVMRVAASLGADVPYFLVGGAALALGRGEQIYPLPDVPPMGVLIAQPAFGVATCDAYAWYAAARPRSGTRVQTLAVPWRPAPLELANDLEAPVTARHPEILDIRRWLLRQGAGAALMSGSGSAVFGLFGTVAAARAVGGRAAARWRVVVTRPLSRRAYRQRMGWT